MTEQEAKTKRCCGPATCGDAGTSPDWGRAGGWGSAEMSAALQNVETAVREASYLASRPRTCIGSACMAWRWGILHPLGGFIEFMPTPAVDRTISGKERPVGGYCGLAGKP